ncbi:MAG: aspartate aminotransferase family protein [Pseudomonadota bacterium]
MNALLKTYGRKDISFSKGEGVWIWDQKGDQYLDALSGIAVCGLGHAHADIAETISSQAKTLIHTSNIYRIPAQEILGERLCSLTGMEGAFFCNSGAEANEAAIKLARLHGHVKGIEAPSTIVFENSFHGRTMATLTATGNRKAHAGFEPLVSGFIRAPYNDIETVKQICENNSNIAAIFVEPVQGEGGINIPHTNFLSELRKLCDQYELLLILDEVQTGNGRTGKWFAFQHTDIAPDVITTAKGLGNGVPIGVCLAKNSAATLFAPGSHGSTFGGNPLACHVALKVLDIIEKDKLLDNAKNMGHHMLKEFKNKLDKNPLIKDIRGHGLMIGIELIKPCAEIVDIALEKKLLVNVTASSVIRLLPPLITDQEQADKIVNLVCDSIDHFGTTQI